MADGVPNTDLITLTRLVFHSQDAYIDTDAALWSMCIRHVLSEQFRLGTAATGDLTLLLTAIQVTSKFLATNVRKARLINLYVPTDRFIGALKLGASEI